MLEADWTQKATDSRRFVDWGQSWLPPSRLDRRSSEQAKWRQFAECCWVVVLSPKLEQRQTEQQPSLQALDDLPWQPINKGEQ